MHRRLTVSNDFQFTDVSVVKPLRKVSLEDPHPHPCEARPGPLSFPTTDPAGTVVATNYLALPDAQLPSRVR